MAVAAIVAGTRKAGGGEGTALKERAGIGRKITSSAQVQYGTFPGIPVRLRSMVWGSLGNPLRQILLKFCRLRPNSR